MGSTADNLISSGRGKSFAEFFAGIGLVHMGLRRGSWQCLYANDIEPKKKAMYEGHFGPSPYYHVEDIWNTSAILGRVDSPAFLATASFPCVDLSLAGHWRGFEGERSSTYFGFLQVIRELGAKRPKLIMLENVSGFITSQGGDDFKRAVRELAELGYWIDSIVLDAKWFVPQSRPRAFVFGFHESLDCPLLLRQQRDSAFGDPWMIAVSRSAALRPKSLRQLVGAFPLATGWATVDFSAPHCRPGRLAEMVDLDAGQQWWPAEDVARHYEMMEPPSKARVDELIASRATAVGAAFRRTRHDAMRCEVRFDMAGCLRTPKGGSAKQIIVAVIDGLLKMRWMSAREYARLQGAGDFRFDAPELQAMYGFGDAVCVPAIEWIDKNILTPVHESSMSSSLARVAVATA